MAVASVTEAFACRCLSADARFQPNWNCRKTHQNRQGFFSFARLAQAMQCWRRPRRSNC